MPCRAVWLKSASPILPINTLPPLSKPSGHSLSRTTTILPSFGSLSPLSLSEQRAVASHIVLVCVHSSLYHVHLDTHPSMVRFPDACSTVHSLPRLSTLSRPVLLLPSPTQSFTDTRRKYPLEQPLTREGVHPLSSVNNIASIACLMLKESSRPCLVSPSLPPVANSFRHTSKLIEPCSARNAAAEEATWQRGPVFDIACSIAISRRSKTPVARYPMPLPSLLDSFFLLVSLPRVVDKVSVSIYFVVACL